MHVTLKLNAWSACKDIIGGHFALKMRMQTWKLLSKLNGMEKLVSIE